MLNTIYRRITFPNPTSLLIAGLFAASRLPSHSAIYSPSPNQDAYANDHGTTFNDDELDIGYRLFIEGPSLYRTALRFDLPGSLSSATIQSATLKLYYFDAWETFDTQTVRVQRATQSWAENSLPYDISLDAGSSEALVGGNGSNFRWISWDVTSAVNSWAADPAANFGLVLSSSGAGNAVRFISRENASTSLRPVLEVNYVEQPIVEDVYGHFLYIANNQNTHYNFYNFTNRLLIRNPTLNSSRNGYVELSGFDLNNSPTKFPIPSIPGGSTIEVDVDGALYSGDVYATVYENAADASQPAQAQDSRTILRDIPNSAPPDAGVPVGGESQPAPQFSPLPALASVVIIGPTSIPGNSSAIYRAKAVFDNGTSDTNAAAAWTSTSFGISSSGQVTAGSVSSETPVTITGTLRYGQITKSASIEAKVLPTVKTTPTVNWQNPTDIVYTTPLGDLQLNATASVDGTYTYSPPAGTVLGGGPQMLNLTFMPADPSYNTVSKTVTLNVQKAVPVLNWANPPDITYGQLLGNLQLSATAFVEGTFSYSPTFGTLLDAGPHTLSATFSPTVANNYTPVSATVTLHVAKADQTIQFALPTNVLADSTIDIEGTASSGLPVTFKLVSGPASLSGNKLTITSAGPIAVAASQSGNANYNPAAEVQKSLTGIARIGPPLKISHSREILTVTWPATDAAFVLEETSNPSNGPWFAIPVVEVDQNEFIFRSNSLQGNAFFRLRKRI